MQLRRRSLRCSVWNGKKTEMEACSSSAVGHGEEGVAAVRGKRPPRGGAAFSSCVVGPGAFLGTPACAVPIFLPFNAAGAAVQKQLLELQHAMFVYYRSNLPLRISIIIPSACEPTLPHTEKETDEAADSVLPTVEITTSN